MKRLNVILLLTKSINHIRMYRNIHEIGNDIRFIFLKKIFHFYGKYKKDILEID